MSLVFDPERHRYTLGGEDLPGVTTVIKPLYDFSHVDPEVLARAARYGTAVHQMVELRLSDRLDYSTLDEALYGPLEALERWLDEVGMDEPAVIDVKSRAYNRDTDPLQLAAYHQLYLENELAELTVECPMASVKFRYAGTADIIIPAPGGAPITNWRILYLGQDGRYTYTPCYDANAWPVFARLLSDYHRHQATNEIINSWRNRI